MEEISSIKLGRTKIIIIGLIFGLVFSLSSGYFAHQFVEKTKTQRLLYLKQVVQIARNSIDPILIDYRNFDISMEDALKQIRNLLRRMVYEDHMGKNYIFMSSYDGIMLVQPFEPEKEMTDFWDLKDSDGVFIIRALVKTAKSKVGQGYVTYHYNRPGETSAQEKVSFVVGIPELGCYIGTGQYMADIHTIQRNYIIKTVGLTLILLVLLLVLVTASIRELRTQNTLLQKAEQELKAIFDNTFQLIGSLSPEGKLLKANRSSLELINQHEADVVGKPFWETSWWIDEESKRRLQQAIHDCSQGEFCRFETTHRVEKSGNIFVDFNLSPIRDEEGNIISLLAEGRDVTEQTEIRNDLIREQAFFDYIIESLPGLFYLYKYQNEHYVLKKWNHKQFEKILGYSPDELIDARISLFVNDGEKSILDNAVTHLLETGSLLDQIDTKTKDNRTVPIFYMAKYFEHAGDKFIVGTGIELTEKIKAEAERKKLETMLVQSQKMEAIGTLAGGIAHDFNNILTGVLGYAELSKEKLAPEDPIRKMQSQIIGAGIRAKNLVDQILIFSRHSEPEMQPIQLDTILKDALNLIRSSIPTTIEIKQNIPTDLGAILADATQIHQIIMNLCTNAYHSMRESGGILTVNLSEKHIEKDTHLHPQLSLDPKTYLLLEVIDTGHGIDQAVLSKIFDPYFTTKEKGEGTGLGLSVVHGIVKNCGGEITVHSRPGKGTKFSVYFPKISRTPQETGGPVKSMSYTGSERVLLIDDDQMIVEMRTQSLTELGYLVSAFSNSVQAFEAFTENPYSFDLIITDMTMPQMTGVDISERILEIRPQIPIILCTGYSEIITREKALDIGIKSFLMKPVLNEVLAKTIREVLEDDIN